MKYEVNETNLFEVKDIKSIVNYQSELKHIETTFDFEKYLLIVVLKYIDINDLEKEVDLELPLSLNTSMTETLTATLKDVKLELEDDKVLCDYTLEINVVEIEEETQVFEEKVTLEIVEENNSNLNVKEVITISDEDFLKGLKTDYIKYKVINLAEENIDKISAKYNLSMEYLYELKRNNSKVIVYDNE